MQFMLSLFFTYVAEVVRRLQAFMMTVSDPYADLPALISTVANPGRSTPQTVRHLMIMQFLLTVYPSQRPAPQASRPSTTNA